MQRKVIHVEEHGKVLLAINYLMRSSSSVIYYNTIKSLAGYRQCASYYSKQKTMGCIVFCCPWKQLYDQTCFPTVPAVPSSCNITLSYDQSSRRLLFINSTWDTVPVCHDKKNHPMVYNLLPKRFIICSSILGVHH